MKRLLLSATLACSAVLTPAWGQTPLTADEAREIANDAYVYAYPLVLSEITRLIGTNVEAPVGSNAPVNQFAHMREFPDHTFTIVVRPNADTLYSNLGYDVRAEPIVITLPDAGDRYFLLPFLDFWSDVFTVPGTRTTGGGAQTFAIVGPDWQGDLPEGVRAYRRPTGRGLLIGRTQTNGKADYAAVHAFQDGITATPLGAWGTDYKAPRGVVREGQDQRPPPDQIDAMDPAAYFAMFAELMKENPPHEMDAPILDRMARIGIVPGESYAVSAQPAAVQQAVAAAPGAALPKIKAAFRDNGTVLNGWSVNLSRMGVYGTDYLARAGVAYAAYGANLVEDAIYPSAYTDETGEPLSSDRGYVLHFPADALPPARAFWSLTMYDDRQLFTENPIGRYAIGDRDDLRFNDDGSLDLYIQRDSPGAERESNWLPAPATGGFSMNLRIYWPTGEALHGTGCRRRSGGRTDGLDLQVFHPGI